MGLPIVMLLNFFKSSDKCHGDVSHNCFDPKIRIEECDKYDVDVQVLSTVPVMFSYWAKSKDTADLSMILNDHIADLVTKFPKRFIGLGTLPMQDAELSINQLQQPKIVVCGLNPHAGENGYLGSEEKMIIEPTIKNLKKQGLNLVGPASADTVYIDDNIGADVFLAMYHDQGLPVLKYKGFGNAVNITLGLPFLRTSVDHGTALDMAGSGKAKSDRFG